MVLRGSNGSKIEGQPTSEAGAEARYAECREGPQEATAQGRLAQPTK
jgi:hypothetical protein